MCRRGNDYFFVVLYCFSNMCVLISCKNTISKWEAVELFFIHVWVHFGLPSSIISDRGSRFLVNFWKTLWERMDTNMRYSTPSILILMFKQRFSTEDWYNFLGGTIASIQIHGMDILSTFKINARIDINNTKNTTCFS